MDHRKRLALNATTIGGPSALDLANARKSSFPTILVFDEPPPKSFAQPGDHHSCQASNTGSALKKRIEIFKKCSWSKSELARKCPVTGRSFQKELQDIVETKSTRARTFGAKFYKSAGTKKTLRNVHNSGKKRDNFELPTNIVP